MRGEEMRRLGELEAAAISEHAAAAAALEKIQRYEERALARRRKALRELGCALTSDKSPRGRPTV